MPHFPTKTDAPFLGLGSEASLHALADALPEALFTTDLAGRVTYWNPSARRITGWSADDALGKDCSILAGDAVRGCSCGAGPLRCGLAELGRTSKTCTLRTKDGRLLLIVKNAVPLYGAPGEVVGALETFTEVGEEGFEPRCAVPRARNDEGRPVRHRRLAPGHGGTRRTIGLVARSNATVMVLGESGSGKECVAQAIHDGSRRAGAPFVRVSCSALNENLLESELFGHVKGAFTGALRDRRGRFQEADGGTLLLDEIGDVSPAVQVKLLRVIEQREIERVGESVPVKVDVRLLCATHRDLKAMVTEGRFRADLYFRLAVFPVRVPPLREHASDIPLLAEAWRARLRAAGDAPPAGISPAAMAALQAYAWPGNVRELNNVLEFAALRAAGGIVEPRDLPAEVLGQSAPVASVRVATAPARRASEIGTAEIQAAVEACAGNRAEAARRLGISRVTLWKRLRQLGDGDGAG